MEYNFDENYRKTLGNILMELKNAFDEGLGNDCLDYLSDIPYNRMASFTRIACLDLADGKDFDDCIQKMKIIGKKTLDLMEKFRLKPI